MLKVDRPRLAIYGEQLDGENNKSHTSLVMDLVNCNHFVNHTGSPTDDIHTKQKYS